MAKPLALTFGEPAGIGPDIAIKAWLRRDELKLPAFYLLGDRDFLGRRAKALGVNIRLAEVRAEGVEHPRVSRFGSEENQLLSKVVDSLDLSGHEFRGISDLEPTAGIGPDVFRILT